MVVACMEFDVGTVERLVEKGGAVLFGMRGCIPCTRMKEAYGAFGEIEPVTYVWCRPSQARQMITEGRFAGFPTVRVYREGVPVLELVGFPEAADDVASHLAVISDAMKSTAAHHISLSASAGT